MSVVAGVILAAGEGTRMRSPLPKVLHEICGLPMILHVVRAFREARIRDAVVVLGRGSDEVRRVLAGTGTRFAVQSRRRGTADALAAARGALGRFSGDLVVACADAPLVSAPTLRALVARHRESGNFTTVCSFELPDPAGYGRVVPGPVGTVRAIVEEKEATDEQRRIREVNSGLYCFRAPAVFKDLARVRPSAVKGELYLTDVIQLAASRGDRVGRFQSGDPDEFLGVNTMGELAEAGSVLRRRLCGRLMAGGVRIVDPENTYIDEDVKIGPGTVIHPYTVIRRGVRIGKDCHVGPFAHLRGATVLADGAEVGNFVEGKSVRMGRAKAKHLAYLGDATIGAKANIGAGAIIANYDGKKKWPTRIGAGAFIGSGSVLVAPVRIGKNAVVGAGAVVTRRRNVKPGAVVVGVPARPLKKK